MDELRTAYSRSIGNYACLPLEDSSTPTDHAMFDNLSDDEIFSMAPHVVVHIMRTASQNGTQIISPRQIPSAHMVKKLRNDSRQPFMHIAGSEADRKRKWPTLPGESRSHLRAVEDTPMVKSGMRLATRRPAPARSVITGFGIISNPFHKAWMKSQAIVDFQRREDVGGDAEELAVVLAGCWGLPSDCFSDVGITTLAHRTSLRDTAIVADRAFARSLLPVHDRRVIAVAATNTNGTAFGENKAIDWTSLRVASEAKLGLTVYNESHSLMEVSGAPAYMVGTASIGAIPGHMIVYHPNSATVWDYSPATFRAVVDLSAVGACAAVKGIVAEELIRDFKVVRPKELMRVYEASVSWVRTQTYADMEESDSAFVSPVAMVMKAIAPARTNPRRINGMLRTWISDALAASDKKTTVKFARMVISLFEMIDASNGILSVLEITVSQMARYLVSLDASLVQKVHASMTLRGDDPEAAYIALCEEVPPHFRLCLPSTRGWSWLACYFILHPPDEKWVGFRKHIRQVGIHAIASHLTIPSLARLRKNDDPIEALALKAREVVSANIYGYSASYDGVALSSTILARQSDVLSEEIPRQASIYKTTAEALRTNAYLWSFRSRAIQSIRCHIGEGRITPPKNAHSKVVETRLFGTVTIWITIAPYACYDNLRRGCSARALRLMENMPREPPAGRVSSLFSSGKPALDRIKLARLGLEEATKFPACVRYAVAPETVGVDIERFMNFALEDAERCVENAEEHQDLLNAPSATQVKTYDSMDLDISIPEPVDRTDGWSMLAALDFTEQEFVTEIMDNDEEAWTLMAMEYLDPPDLMRAFEEYVAHKVEAEDDIANVFS